MIKKFAFIALTIATLANGSAYAGSLMPAYGNQNDSLINHVDTVIDQLGTVNGFVKACYGCISERTGLPRTHYVRPHYRNGSYVNGYYRSRR